MTRRLDLTQPPSSLFEAAYKWRPTGLYRAYGRDGRLLYVGISQDVERRMVKHQLHHWYWDVYGMDVEFWPHWRRAKLAEQQAIESEWPLWNISQSPWAAVAASRRGSERKVRRREQHILRVQALTRTAVLNALHWPEAS
jgi:hypothetical protein